MYRCPLIFGGYSKASTQPQAKIAIAESLSLNGPDVRLVIHFNLPKTLAELYQESGRAGRDGLPSRSVVFYSLYDRHRMDYLLAKEVKKKRCSSGEMMPHVLSACIALMEVFWMPCSQLSLRIHTEIMMSCIHLIKPETCASVADCRSTVT